jgi:hypothetical protein
MEEAEKYPSSRGVAISTFASSLPSQLSKIIELISPWYQTHSRWKDWLLSRPAFLRQQKQHAHGHIASRVIHCIALPQEPGYGSRIPSTM